MRIGISSLLAFVLITLIFAGCNNENNKDELFFGSDQLFTKVTIGDVPVQNGHTYNVPLAHISSIRLEMARPVTPESLNGTIDFAIRIENIDKNTTTLLTESVLDENGDLVWLDTSNRTLEFRMTHNMSYVIAGGAPYTLGTLGDRFRIRIDFLTGVAADGRGFSFSGDEFEVIWTESAAGLVE
jgi:hypothetical protein